MTEEDDSQNSPQFLILPLVQPGEDDFVDKSKIRELTSNGLDYAQPEDRCLAWLILIDIYPQRAREWPKTLNELVTLYQTYITECQISTWESKKFPVHVTDPQIYQLPNNSLMQLIHTDIVRTSHHIYLLPYTNDDGKQTDSINLYSLHLRRLERILYIFANVNKNLSYMQGFNEIVVPFYYSIYCGKSLFNDDFTIEALSFHCLHQLLSYTDLKDLFTADDTSLYLSRIEKFPMILKNHVPNAYHILIEQFNIPENYYCYRWFLLLFSQEYSMPELVQVWDSLFTHFENLVDFELYVGAAQIEMVETEFIGKTYPELLELLQSIQIRNIYQLLNKANEFWQKDNHNPTLLTTVTSTVTSAVTSVKGLVSKLTKIVHI